MFLTNIKYMEALFEENDISMFMSKYLDNIYEALDDEHLSLGEIYIVRDAERLSGNTNVSIACTLIAVEQDGFVEANYEDFMPLEFVSVHVE
ncbi:hypothetical protein [Salicibibacter halophilus]|uniref:hypothetical protein n=1 Tax=Salicibibacter halophilus TaxID=2502791 RepID=UPI001D045AC1|nr:hypothetical protein [Salicibibacter halophilus]